MYVYIYTHTYTHLHTYAYVYVYTDTYTYTYIHIHIHMCVYIYVCACIHIYMCVCVCVKRYVCIDTCMHCSIVSGKIMAKDLRPRLWASHPDTLRKIAKHWEMGPERCFRIREFPKIRGTFKGFLKGIYKGSIKGLGFRVSENSGCLIWGVLIKGSCYLRYYIRVPYFRKLPCRL